MELAFFVIFFAAIVCVAAPIEEPVITLESAFDRALESDQSIRIAALEIRKANLLPLHALTTLGPRLNGNIGYDRSQRTVSGALTQSPQSENKNVDLSFQQTLLDFTVFPAFRLGRLEALAARLQYRFTTRQTLFGVAQAFYEVLKDQSIVAINRQTVDLATKQLDVAQNRYDLGAVARVDVSRAIAQLEDSRMVLIQSENALAIARNDLGNILNLGGDTGFVLAEPPGAPIREEPFPAVLSDAYKRREDFKIAKIAIDQDVERRNGVIGQYGPRVVAGAGQSWSDPNTSANSRAWDASVSVQLPFLTGGQRTIDLLTANRQVDQTRLNFEKVSKTIQQEVKNAWLQVRTLQGTLKALRAEVDANVQNYNDIQNQYQAGAATSLDVQVALRDLNNARTSLTGQSYDYQVALRDLERAQADFQEERMEKFKKR